MAKLVEELIVIKLSKLIKDRDNMDTVLDLDKRAVIEETAPALIEEIIADPNVVVELADLG
jgi:hypothetical protein